MLCLVSCRHTELHLGPRTYSWSDDSRGEHWVKRWILCFHFQQHYTLLIQSHKYLDKLLPLELHYLPGLLRCCDFHRVWYAV